MTVLARGSWIVSAALFVLVTLSVLQVDYAGWIPFILAVLVIAMCAWRPASGLEILSAAIPVSAYLMSQRWNGNVSWAEVYGCAALAGLSIDAARRSRARLPFAVGVPAELLGLIVVASIAVSLSVKALTLGPAFAGDLFRHLTRLYFTEEGAYPGLHTGMLLLEGLLLFGFAVRSVREKPAMAMRIAAAATIGATLAGLMNVAHLLQAALRGPSLVPELARLARTLRWNVEYPDYNAAGSYFVMLLCFAAALIAARGPRRRAWTICGIVIASALWLTGSRAAYIGGVLAVAAASAVLWVKPSGRRRFAAGAALAMAVLTAVAFITFAAPQRGDQHSSRVAADIRLQMALAGGRMIAAHPMFGVGVGEFYMQSRNFVSPELITMFPVSTHENAHNNFVQVAAELGLPGGISFVWLVVAGLFLVARHAARTRAPAVLLMLTGIGAFIVTWLAGHPLLIPEAAYAFWILFGTAVGAATTEDVVHAPRSLQWLVALAAAVLVVATPMHARAVMDETALEHVGFGWSSKWLLSPDGIRYRSATGRGTVFVPARSAFTFSVNPRAERPVRLEVRLEGRVADIITLSPERWNDVALPARSDRASALFIPMDLHVLDGGDQTEIWLTKVRALEGR